MARSVALVLAITLAAPSALAQRAGADVTYVAQQRYDEGLRAYEDDRWDEALDHFRASSAVLHSANTRLMIARCLRNLERWAEAHIEYELTEREASDRARAEPRFEATRAAAAEEGAAVADHVGYVRIAVDGPPEGLVVEVAGRTVPRGAIELPIPVDAGEVSVRWSAPGHRTLERTITVAAQQTREVALALERTAIVAPSATAATASGEVIGWTATAVALAALTSGVALLVAAQSRFEGLVSECGDAPCPPELQGAVSEGRAFEASAGVTLAIAAAAAVVAVVGFVLAAIERTSPRPARSWRDAVVIRW